MSINLTDEIDVKTKKGKLGAAKQIFLEGDTQTVEKEIQDINSRHNTLNTKHESLSRTVQGIAVTGGANTATNVTYNNDSSGLNAENAQDAIDELQNSKFDKTSILQESGNSEDKVMSQKATTTAIADETARAKAAEEAINFDVSALNGGVVFESLSALLSSSDLSTLIPTSVRHGGMTIRFIQGSEQSADNKYVQYRLMSDSFNTTPSNWQGVDDEPVEGSKDMITSGSVEKVLFVADHAVPQLSKNLVDVSKFKTGYGLSPAGMVTVNQDLNLSDYIPINGQNVVANGYNSAYWQAGVYNKDRQWLRAVTSNWYTYQEGDFYIRINFLASNTQPIANYGIDLISYEPYMPIDGYFPKSSVIKEISSNIENISNYNTNAPINFIFESGTFSADMTESDDNTKVRSNILKVGHRRKVYVNIPNGFQYIIYASNDGVTYMQQNTWFTPKVFTADNQEKGYAFVRILIKKSNNNVIFPYEFIDFNISLDGNIIDDAVLQDSLLVDKDRGNFMSTNVASQEIEGSSISGIDKSYITPYINAKSRYYPKTRKIVAVNHDDLTKIDYRGTRQIYNKYDFHSNFNFILYPFATVTEKDEVVKYVKKLIKEGHSIGLHAYFSSSAWIINKLFDVRPDGTATFAPNVTELKPAAGSNLNAFNQTVTATTKFRDLNYVNPPQSVANINVVDSTQGDVNVLTQHYCVFTQNENITGVDLDGNIVTKGRLEWAEYWYNNLVSNVGYSTKGSVSERFAEDYAIPDGGNVSDYYPDAEHLLNGKIVHYDDINNPNYADSDYQKVGYFTKGLFIGCSSTCNSEVIERIIHLSTMVARYYFGIDHFDYFNRHGVQYADIYWLQNGYPFDNREKTVLHHERGYWYNTFSGIFTTAYDAFKVHGIRMSGHSNIMPAKFGAELGLYFGQDGKRSSDFDEILNGVDGLISFTNLLGSDGDTMNYSTFINYFGSKINWIKYAYENAGKTITGANSSTIKMTTHLKDAIDIIRSLEGTNKIPFFSFDSIKDNYSAQVGIDLLCRYCYMNSIEIVTPEIARQIAIGLGVDYKQNYYPNPKFRQSLIDQFGAFNSKDAYTPDGMRFVQKVNNNNDYDISVEDVIISNVSEKVLSQTNVISRVRIFGLPSGNYKFSIKGKGHGTVFILLNKNSDLAASITNLYSRAAHYISINTQNWTDYNYEFTINEPYLGNIDRRSAASMLSCGGQDNIINVEIIYYGNEAETLYITNPKMNSKSLSS